MLNLQKHMLKTECFCILIILTDAHFVTTLFPKQGGIKGVFPLILEDIIMKKIIAAAMIIFIISTSISGCSGSSLLSASNPVTLELWHVYGEQADSPMNRLIKEFNETVGRQKGIVINVTLMTNAKDVGSLLMAAKKNEPGFPELPDLFFAHKSDIENLDDGCLLDWREAFPKNELGSFVEGFLQDGMVDGSLKVLPVSKSTNLLFVNGSQFERFSTETGVLRSELSSWDGFFEAAEKYYAFSGGKPMCAFDYLLDSIRLNAQARASAEELDMTGEEFKSSYLEFMQPFVKGHITVADMYSNTQVMTGETLAGVGSSAAILYYNDTVTYPDNTTEPTNLIVLPYPKTSGGRALMQQAGVGLCAYKTTEQKAEAAYIFASWLTESQRNTDFVSQTGYMPVRTDAYEKLQKHDFSQEEYTQLYNVLNEMIQGFAPVSNTNSHEFYNLANELYAALREAQPEWTARYEAGEDASALAEEAWTIYLKIADRYGSL